MAQKVKCSHILVEKQSQALQILEEIKKGKNLVQQLRRYHHAQVQKKKEI